MTAPPDTVPMETLYWAVGGMATAWLAAVGALWKLFRNTQRRADVRADKSHSDEISHLREQVAQERTERQAAEQRCETRVAKLEASNTAHVRERFDDAKIQAELLSDFALAIREMAQQFHGTTDALRSLHAEVSHLQKDVAVVLERIS